jgi:hypothetical protein
LQGLPIISSVIAQKIDIDKNKVGATLGQKIQCFPQSGSRSDGNIRAERYTHLLDVIMIFRDNQNMLYHLNTGTFISLFKIKSEF